MAKKIWEKHVTVSFRAFHIASVWSFTHSSLASHIVSIKTSQPISIFLSWRKALCPRTFDHFLQTSLFFVKKFDQPFHATITVPLISTKMAEFFDFFLQYLINFWQIFGQLLTYFWPIFFLQNWHFFFWNFLVFFHNFYIFFEIFF